MWKATVVTLHPDAFPGTLGVSLYRKKRGRIWDMTVVDLVSFSSGGRCDDKPYGGLSSPVIRPDVVHRAISSLDLEDVFFVFPSPRGRLFNKDIASYLSFKNHCFFLCGRFGGIDQRVIDYYKFFEVSIGDYVVSGGEIAVQVIMEACIRLLPGFMNSFQDESFEDNLLQHPLYTRPSVWNDIHVPCVLRSGHHRNIMDWKKETSKSITRKKRPDIWSGFMQKVGDKDESC